MSEPPGEADRGADDPGTEAEEDEQPLPLFPLSSVLFPGAPLPLHIFESRYRELVAELLSRPSDSRFFGVIAIRSGREAGQAVPDLWAIGTAAELRSISRYPDGRYDLLSLGVRRFRLLEVDSTSRPFLLGRVRWLTERENGVGEPPPPVEPVRRAMLDYVEQLLATGQAEIDLPELPAEPLALSYLVAAALLLPVTERQALLEAPNAGARLRRLLWLLRRERVLLERLAAVSAPDLVRVAPSPN